MSAAALLVCGACRDPRGAGARCPRCGAENPDVGGVVVPGEAGARLSALLESLREARRALSTPDVMASPRGDAAAVVAARRADLELLERLASGAAACLAERAPDGFRLSGLVARYASGWPLDRLLPYFLVDWGGTDAFAAVAAAAEARTGGARGAAAVLGCGAGGLVRRLARSFGAVAGIDLSIPSLLLARELLDGRPVTLHLAETGWRPVALAGAAPPAANVALAAADAVDLPLADGSVDVVTTQYLLDIVPDAAALGREVSRVLREGGLWISFGLPFRPRGDPALLGPRPPAELPPFFEELGFALESAEAVPHAFLDLSRFEPLAGGARQGVQLLAAKKRAALPPVDDFVRYARGEREPLLRRHPRIAPGVVLHALEGRARGRGGAHETFEVRVDGAGRTGSLPVGREVLRLLESFWRALDGIADVTEVLAATRRGSGIPLEEPDFVAALRGLRNLGLVELG